MVGVSDAPSQSDLRRWRRHLANERAEAAVYRDLAQRYDGEEREMEFLSNNLVWAASSIVDLYESRWQIEVFFKEIKQTLQLCDFLGHNKNAVLWQVWTALILYVLLRFLAFANHWQHGFKRFFCLLRSSVWDGFLVASLASLCGTAGGIPATRPGPQQLYLPGFGPREMRP